MVTHATKKYEAYGLEAKAKALRLDNPLQIVTVASLVQAEGKTSEDYRKMAEVVYNSLQHMSDEDAMAMAVYLKSLPMRDAEPPPTTQERLVSPEILETGRKVYALQCAMCHGEEGRGHPPKFPPLAGNQSITMSSPVNSIRMVLNGGYPPSTEGNPRPYGMPPFAGLLSDNEVAGVVSYIRTAWGNRGAPVSAREANELRSAPLN